MSIKEAKMNVKKKKKEMRYVKKSFSVLMEKQSWTSRN